MLAGFYIIPIMLYLCAATGLEDIAMLRSELESLYEKLFNNQQEEMKGLAAHMNSCIEKCRLCFDKVGKQIQTYEHSLKQLKEEKDDLLKQCQDLKNIEQGIYSEHMTYKCM